MERQFYICKHCGNLVGMISEKKAPLTCCGEHMQHLTANTTDAAQEKHVPVITRDSDKLTVKVGSVPHPMTPEHYIAWICVQCDNLTQRIGLSPDSAPEATFTLPENATGKVFAYCNLHSLWATEF